MTEVKSVVDRSAAAASAGTIVRAAVRPDPVDPDGEFPGRQTKARHRKFRFVSALLSLIVFFLASGLILKATWGFGILPEWIKKILGPFNSSVAATVLVGTLSLYYVRLQFALGLRPIAEYRSSTTVVPEFGMTPGRDPKYFVVLFRNPGAGPLFITKVEWRVALDGAPVPAVYGSFASAFGRIAEQGFDLEKDLGVVKLSPGGVYESRGERPVFALDLRSKHAFRLTCLDVRIEFEGTLGDAYVKEMYYIPRRGLARPAARELTAADWE